MLHARSTCCLLLVFALLGLARAQDAPATAPAEHDKAKLPFVQVDVENRQVRVECEALGVEAPLEFFCVLAGTAEHEAVLRTRARPSHIHLALLMLGLEPGQPVRYSEAAKKWFPPHGPPLNIHLAFERDGKTVTLPAHRTMRNLNTKQEMPQLTWIFAGSRVMEDGVYAADSTGYVVSVVNFDLSLIDIPMLASSQNEMLEWERNPDQAPPAGAKVMMILEPAGKTQAPATAPAGSAGQTDAPPPQRLSDVKLDEAKVDRLRELWQQRVAPHHDAMRQAAQTHYDVIANLRREQQRLVDEADRIQRVIEELEQQYQQMTTPRPEPIDAREP
jgi:hypothetical protein